MKYDIAMHHYHLAVILGTSEFYDTGHSYTIRQNSHENTLKKISNPSTIKFSLIPMHTMKIASWAIHVLTNNEKSVNIP